MTSMTARMFLHWPQLLMERTKIYGCVERVTALTGGWAQVMDGHACDVAMIPSMTPSPPRPSPHMLAVGSLFQMPHLAMLAAVETMMIQMMPRCRKPMLSPRQWQQILRSTQSPYLQWICRDVSVEPWSVAILAILKLHEVTTFHEFPKCLLTPKLIKFPKYIKIPKYPKILKYAIVSQFLITQLAFLRNLLWPPHLLANFWIPKVARARAKDMAALEVMQVQSMLDGEMQCCGIYIAWLRRMLRRSPGPFERGQHLAWSTAVAHLLHHRNGHTTKETSKHSNAGNVSWSFGGNRLLHTFLQTKLQWCSMSVWKEKQKKSLNMQAWTASTLRTVWTISLRLWELHWWSKVSTWSASSWISLSVCNDAMVNLWKAFATGITVLSVHCRALVLTRATCMTPRLQDLVCWTDFDLALMPSEWSWWQHLSLWGTRTWRTLQRFSFPTTVLRLQWSTSETLTRMTSHNSHEIRTSPIATIDLLPNKAKANRRASPTRTLPLSKRPTLLRPAKTPKMPRMTRRMTLQPMMSPMKMTKMQPKDKMILNIHKQLTMMKTAKMAMSSMNFKKQPIALLWLPADCKAWHWAASSLAAKQSSSASKSRTAQCAAKKVIGKVTQNVAPLQTPRATTTAEAKPTAKRQLDPPLRTSLLRKRFCMCSMGMEAGDQSLLRMNTKMTPKRPMARFSHTWSHITSPTPIKFLAISTPSSPK